jgi:hypothetical protein
MYQEKPKVSKPTRKHGAIPLNTAIPGGQTPINFRGTFAPFPLFNHQPDSMQMSSASTAIAAGSMAAEIRTHAASSGKTTAQPTANSASSTTPTTPRTTLTIASSSLLPPSKEMTTTLMEAAQSPTQTVTAEIKKEVAPEPGMTETEDPLEAMPTTRALANDHALAAVVTLPLHHASVRTTGLHA